MLQKLRRHIDPISVCSSTLDTIKDHQFSITANSSLRDRIIIPEDDALVQINATNSGIEGINFQEYVRILTGYIGFLEMMRDKNYAVEIKEGLVVLRHSITENDSIHYGGVFFDGRYIIQGNVKVYPFLEDNFGVESGKVKVYSRKESEHNFSYPGIKLCKTVQKAMKEIVYDSVNNQSR